MHIDCNLIEDDDLINIEGNDFFDKAALIQVN